MKAATSAVYFMIEVLDPLKVLNLTDGMQKSNILEETSLDYTSIQPHK